MVYWLYNLALLLASPVIVGLLLTKKRCQRGIGSRLGVIPPELQRLQKPVVWIHAVSLGEVSAIVPLLLAMKKQFPHWPLVVSTVTETGREVVVKKLEGVAIHCYAPLDFAWAVERYVRTLQPRLFLLVESEFWPNLLRSLHRHHVPICLVNGRISSRSFGRYLWIKGLMKRVLACLDLALMQSAPDAERIRILGASSASVQITGNMKFDLSPSLIPSDHASPSVRTQLNLHESEHLIVAGSTHPQEEEYLLQAYRDVVKTDAHAVLLLAPRHIERTARVEQLSRQYGFSCVRRSLLRVESEDAPGCSGPRVIVLDTRGELASLYGEASVAFVGGTLVPVGGHNLLEPAQWGKPVVFGPHVDHCRDIARLLLEAGGGIQVDHEADLAPQFLRLLTTPSEAEQRGKQAFIAVQAQRGVVAVNLQWIDRLVNGHVPSSLAWSTLAPSVMKSPT